MLIVPPWQGMDEPQHVALCYELVQTGSKLRVEVDILRSMDAHDFWKQWEDESPNPFPIHFINAGLGPGTLAQPMYYSLGALLLRVTRPADVVEGLYHLRWLSAVLSVAALIFGWMGTRQMFGGDIAVGALAVSALHPQFLLSAITVNPDALLFVIGAFIWWQLARVATGTERDFSLVLLVVAAVAALLTKRNGIVIVCSSALAAVALMKDGWRVTPRRVAVAGGIAMTAILPVIAGLIFFQNQLYALLSYWGDALSVRRSMENATADQAVTYGVMAVDHFWLVAGWVRFSPPVWWLWIVRAMLSAAAAGVLWTLVRDRSSRRLVLVAGVIVAAHVVAMLFTVFWTVQTAPEARFLFPAYAPLMALACVGLSRLAPAPRRREWFMAVLVLLAVLDATAFTHLLIPLYISW